MLSNKFNVKNILESSVPEYLRKRLSSGVPFVDKILAGGFVPSVTYMFSGDPGAGKSTLMVQVADGLTGNGNIVLFNSVEQTEDQVADLADRIGVKNGFIFARHKSEEDLMKHLLYLQKTYPSQQVFLICDSISSMAGNSRARAQEIGDAFISFCQKTLVIGIFLVHTTKNGKFAGNNAMKHNFDVHLHLNVVSDKDDNGERILFPEKNRFAKKISQEILLTDRGHISKEEYNPDDDLLILDDDDILLVS